MQVIYQHAQAQPVPPSMLNPGLPADVDMVILHALAKKSEERFRSISAFAHAFQTALQDADAPTVVAKRTEPTPANIDMRATLAISDIEALRGITRTLTLPGGRRVNISVPAGAYNGQVIRLEGQGPPSDSGLPGALLVAIAITPTEKSPVVSTAESAVATIPTLSSNSSFPVPQRGLSRANMILLMALALLVIGGSIGFVSLYVATNKQLGTINASATALAQANANTTTTALAQVNATVPAQSTAYATAPPAGNPYTHTGVLALDDPLHDNSKGYGWDTSTNQNNATCAFVNGGYQSSQPADSNFHACFAFAPDFSNFVYEVQMTIVSGQAGGIVFRANPANSTFYYFRVGQDGSYDLWTYVDKYIDHAHHLTSGTSGSSTAIHTGYNQSNLVAVVAQGSSLALYVNQQLVTSVSDNSYSHGQIGIVAYNQGSLAQVVYSNARVWRL